MCFPRLFPNPRCLAVFLAAAVALAMSAGAQQPDTLRHFIAPPASAQSEAQLGYSVAIDGGLTVLGAPYDDIGHWDAGVVKVFDAASGALLQVIANPSPSAFDHFGTSVAIAGTWVVIGAPNGASGSNDAGSAYVYDLSGPTPTVPVFTLDNPSPAAGDEFGRSASISGTRVVIGAGWDDTGATNGGSAYVYDLASATPASPVATLNNPGPSVGDGFGYSLAASGTRVLVGAPFVDTGAENAGNAYVYDLASPSPTVPAVTLNNPSPATFDYFGWAVAISGSRLVVGAPYNDVGTSDIGSAYVYDLTRASPTVPVFTLNNPTPAPYVNFGRSVAISGVRVAVSAKNGGGIVYI